MIVCTSTWRTCWRRNVFILYSCKKCCWAVIAAPSFLEECPSTATCCQWQMMWQSLSAMCPQGAGAVSRCISCARVRWHRGGILPTDVTHIQPWHPIYHRRSSPCDMVIMNYAAISTSPTLPQIIAISAFTMTNETGFVFISWTIGLLTWGYSNSHLNIVHVYMYIFLF